MKLDNYKITKKYDRRRKLSDQQRQEIKDLFFKEKKGIREISRIFESFCSRRLIQFILFPERDQKLKKIVKKEKRWLLYHNTEKRKFYMQNHRAYKKSLLNNKLIK